MEKFESKMNIGVYDVFENIESKITKNEETHDEYGLYLELCQFDKPVKYKKLYEELRKELESKYTEV